MAAHHSGVNRFPIWQFGARRPREVHVQEGGNMFRILLRMSVVLSVVGLVAPAKAQTYLLAFSCLPTTDSNYQGLKANLANIDGCVEAIDWSSVETSRGVYNNFSALDNDVRFAPYVGATCGANLRPVHKCYLVPVIRLVSNNGNNTSTPAYVYGAQWAQHLGTTPLDYAYCGGYEGDKSGSGIGNSGDTTTFPAVWEEPFQVASQNFISALIAHLNGLTTGIGPQILYVRIGYTGGGEAFPSCEPQLETIAGVSGVQALMANYFVPGYKSEADFIHSQTPKTQLEMSVNCGNPLSWCQYNSLPESGDLQADSLGIGNQGLQVGDAAAIQNGQETSNGWYADYTTHPNNDWREMQTLKQSCPTGTPHTRCASESLTTGSLTDIFPIVRQYANLNSLELYTGDVLCTYYPGYNPPQGTPTYTDCQNASYRAAFAGYF
jgi:hypothetical protein